MNWNSYICYLPSGTAKHEAFELVDVGNVYCKNCGKLLYSTADEVFKALTSGVEDGKV